MPSLANVAYRAGAGLARRAPRRVAHGVGRGVARVASRFTGGRRAQVERNLGRVDPSLSGRALRRAVDATFAAYATYWVESFRLPGTSPADLEAGITVEGWEHVEAARAGGNGCIFALPHLGGWEWAGFWVAACQRVPITVVVEALEPPDVYEWFVGLRRSFGMEVVALGPDAGRAVLGALRANHIVCLLSDRDIGGGGVPVELFGEATTLPGGPVTLSLRAGAPVLPVAVYLDDDGHHRGLVRPPLPLVREGRLRDDVTRGTQLLATELEDLIRLAPTQWHLLQPNWPSDPGHPHHPGDPAPPAAPGATLAP